MRFSTAATEIDTLAEYVYNNIQTVSLEHQQTLMRELREKVHEMGIEPEANPFLEIMEALIGI